MASKVRGIRLHGRWKVWLICRTIWSPNMKSSFSFYRPAGTQPDVRHWCWRRTSTLDRRGKTPCWCAPPGNVLMCWSVPLDKLQLDETWKLGRRYANKSVVRFLALSRPSSQSNSSSASSSANSTPSPCPPSLPQDVQNRVAVEEVTSNHSIWFQWTVNVKSCHGGMSHEKEEMNKGDDEIAQFDFSSNIFVGRESAHRPPCSTRSRRLHREVSSFSSVPLSHESSGMAMLKSKMMRRAKTGFNF